MKKYFNLMLILIVGAFVMQGFQCASREMTTAKVAIQNRDYPKAIDYLKQELAKNPANVEALIALVETNVLVKDVPGAFNAYNQLITRDTIAEVKKRKPGLRNQIWTEAFNGAFQDYQKFMSSKDETAANRALERIRIGTELMPRMIDFYTLEASIYELQGNQAKATEAYLKYTKNCKQELDFASINNVYANMPRTSILSKFGKPMNPYKPFINTRGDSLNTDYFSVKGKSTYIFSEKIGNDWIVAGWRVDPPKDWLQGEYSQWTAFNTAPFGALAGTYYREGKKEEALEYIKYLSMLEPSNADANSSMVQLFIELGKQDEAIKQVQDLTQKDPENKVYWGQYGDLYMNLGDYDKAIEQYEKALKLDPNYDFVIRNLASVYKNKASKLQQIEQDKLDKDPKATINTDAFFPWLRKSAELFERSLKTERFTNDMDVLSELTNIYLVLDDKAKLDKVLKSFEAIEATMDEADKAFYYLRLVKIYSDMKNTEKLNEAQKKYEEYSK